MSRIDYLLYFTSKYEKSKIMHFISETGSLNVISKGETCPRGIQRQVIVMRSILVSVLSASFN